MTTKPQTCRDIEPAILAAATGEADARTTHRVDEHVARCTDCRGELGRYRAIDAVARTLPPVEAPSVAAAAALGSSLADLRKRLLTYGISPSPLGNILIARSEQGVALVEYLGAGTTVKASRLARTPGLELEEDGVEVKRLGGELLDYIRGRRTRLEWPLDLRLAGSDFSRAVLGATAAVPYGAVTSYARIAEGLGRRSAVRAVAQALRWNPVPIVVPCHRIVGASGALTGYAGNKIPLKQRLLSVEGVRTLRGADDLHVARARMYAHNFGDTEYCVPTCGSLATQSLARLTLFSSRESAESAGLAPCTSCRPDLHPLPR